MKNIETNQMKNEDQLLSLFAIEELEERLEFKEWATVKLGATVEGPGGTQGEVSVEIPIGKKD